MTDAYKREPDLPDNSPASSKRKPGVEWMARGFILAVVGLLGWLGIGILNYLQPSQAFFNEPSFESLKLFWNNPSLRYVLILECTTVIFILVHFIGLLVMLIGFGTWFVNFVSGIVAYFKRPKTINAMVTMFNNVGTVKHRLPFDEELRRLGKLKNEGHITEAEFDEAKKKILARIE